MSRTVKNLREISDRLNKCISLNANPVFRDLKESIIAAIDQMLVRPPMFIRYQDDGPKGTVGKFDGAWDKLVAIDSEIDEEQISKLLKRMGKGRLNPRFGEKWYDSDYYPSNKVTFIESSKL